MCLPHSNTAGTNTIGTSTIHAPVMILSLSSVLTAKDRRVCGNTTPLCCYRRLELRSSLSLSCFSPPLSGRALACSLPRPRPCSCSLSFPFSLSRALSRSRSFSLPRSRSFSGSRAFSFALSLSFPVTCLLSVSLSLSRCSRLPASRVMSGTLAAPFSFSSLTLRPFSRPSSRAAAWPFASAFTSPRRRLLSRSSPSAAAPPAAPPPRPPPSPAVLSKPSRFRLSCSFLPARAYRPCRFFLDLETGSSTAAASARTSLLSMRLPTSGADSPGRGGGGSGMIGGGRGSRMRRLSTPPAARVPLRYLIACRASASEGTSTSAVPLGSLVTRSRCSVRPRIRHTPSNDRCRLRAISFSGMRGSMPAT
mmetsp:Transcript_36275/g.80744  ORF Transcript_36275/g.80744 Transcript_36275/m.80744 type:complete len:364 (-) Transcript_36275:609-1700(-)